MKDSDHHRAHIRSLSALTFEIKVNLTIKGLPVITQIFYRASLN